MAGVTQLVVDGTGAVEAVLWLKVGEMMYPRASSPMNAAARSWVRCRATTRSRQYRVIAWSRYGIAAMCSGR